MITTINEFRKLNENRNTDAYSEEEKLTLLSLTSNNKLFGGSPIFTQPNLFHFILNVGDEMTAKTVKDIANKYNVSVAEIIFKLKKGIEVELEHTSDEKIATEIAMDHLIEMLDYYEKLETIEEQSKLKTGEKSIEDTIKNLHKISPELKQIALQHLQSYTSAKNGVIHELKPDQNLIDKCKEHDLQIGFGMGIDKDGYFIQTHRARSKSYKSSSDITVKDIKFINSTG